MKVKNVTPKAKTKVQITLNAEEAAILKSLVGTFNSINQSVTAEIWDSLDDMGIEASHDVQSYNGRDLGTLQLVPYV